MAKVTKVVIRIRISKRNRQYNGKKKKGQIKETRVYKKLRDCSVHEEITSIRLYTRVTQGCVQPD
jgi:hypothetical protein